MTVIRNGADKVISCHDVVVGDIMKLSTGDIITADAYAIGANDLQISEKALTGETGTLSLFLSLCMVTLHRKSARALTLEKSERPCCECVAKSAMALTFENVRQTS